MGKNKNVECLTPWIVGQRHIALYIGVSKSTLTKLIASGHLRVNRVGNLTCIHRFDLDAFILFEKPFKKLTKPQRREILSYQNRVPL